MRPGRYPAPAVPPLANQFKARALARLILRGVLRAEHHGQQHMARNGACVVIVNHPSYFDPWLVSLGTRRWITWMAWEEAFSWRGVGWLMTKLGAFGVNLEKAGATSMKTCYEILAQDRALGIFFEGQRTDGFQLNEPRTGAARIALRAGVPVIAVSVAGARKAWPKDRAYPSRGKVRVTYHPPIDSSSFHPQLPMREREQLLTNEVARRIRSCLPEDGRFRH
jgi:1-acyl-sn-glycerol-3-phosphate acyltransferase